MIAVLGGLGAALAFSATTLCYARLTRMMGPNVMVSWVMIVGLAITLPLVLATGIPDALDASSAGWLAIAGVGNVTGLVLTYRALRTGQVGVIAPIVSTEGAIAALISVLAGEEIGAAAGATLVVIATGILLASLGPTTATDATRSTRVNAVALAVLAAVAFGASLYAVGRVGRDLPVAWALLPARLVGVLAIALPLALTGRLWISRPTAPLAVAGGVCEVVGIAAYTLGARHSVAVSAVLASQFGALAALAGYVLFHERLTRMQIAGVVAIAIGVAALSSFQA